MPPRSPKEFFAKFTPPRSASRWTSRLKCNVYFYRTNYAILLALVLAVAFFRNPLALVALSLLGFTVMCLNDPFATSVRCASSEARICHCSIMPLSVSTIFPLPGGRQGDFATYRASSHATRKTMHASVLRIPAYPS